MRSAGPSGLCCLLVGLVQEFLEGGRHEVRPLGRAVIPLQVLHCGERSQSRRHEGSPRAGASGDRVGGQGSQRSLRGLESRHTGTREGQTVVGSEEHTGSPHSQARKPPRFMHPQSTWRKPGPHASLPHSLLLGFRPLPLLRTPLQQDVSQLGRHEVGSLLRAVIPFQVLTWAPPGNRQGENGVVRKGGKEGGREEQGSQQAWRRGRETKKTNKQKKQLEKPELVAATDPPPHQSQKLRSAGGLQGSVQAAAWASGQEVGVASKRKRKPGRQAGDPGRGTAKPRGSWGQATVVPRWRVM